MSWVHVEIGVSTPRSVATPFMNTVGVPSIPRLDAKANVADARLRTSDFLKVVMNSALSIPNFSWA